MYVLMDHLELLWTIYQCFMSLKRLLKSEAMVFAFRSILTSLIFKRKFEHRGYLPEIPKRFPNKIILKGSIKWPVFPRTITRLSVNVISRTNFDVTLQISFYSFFSYLSIFFARLGTQGRWRHKMCRWWYENNPIIWWKWKKEGVQNVFLSQSLHFTG